MKKWCRFIKSNNRTDDDSNKNISTPSAADVNELLGYIVTNVLKALSDIRILESSYVADDYSIMEFSRMRLEEIMESLNDALIIETTSKTFIASKKAAGL